MSSPGAVANHFVRAVLPKGGVLVSLVEVYFDESSADQRVPFTTVAGYIFSADQARKFNTEWAAVLAKYGLPYFRMAERETLARKHGLTTEQMDLRIARPLIKKIKHRTIKGIAALVDEATYEEVLAGRPNIPSAYAFACFGVLIQVRRWMEATGYAGDAAYFFESGDEHQSDAHNFLNRIFSNPRSKSLYHHVGHSFVEKKAVPALQGGDMLAWHTAKAYKNDREGRPQRKDFAALIRPQDARLEYTPNQLRRMEATLTSEGWLPPVTAS